MESLAEHSFHLPSFQWNHTTHSGKPSISTLGRPRPPYCKIKVPKYSVYGDSSCYTLSRVIRAPEITAKAQCAKKVVCPAVEERGRAAAAAPGGFSSAAFVLYDGKRDPIAWDMAKAKCAKKWFTQREVPKERGCAAIAVLGGFSRVLVPVGVR
ncbi:hypothetical protein H2248_011271 [Termitomyces sp. 'cryptogamus']|nr:hypothetical protein H2248_011271 [Termitomyces sp. 'cryptogamus']